uniref:Histidine decarboxylase n=1 Tax=Hanusia phi TaxID=3032 RepID=A0A6T7NP21_9CRYP
MAETLPLSEVPPLPAIDCKPLLDDKHIRENFINVQASTDEDAWKDAGCCLLGYPCNMLYNYSDMHDTMKFHLNNVGDPYRGSNYRINSMEIEKEVLDFFAKHWHVVEEYWGYITSSGTEGNMEGLYIGRERFPDGILYLSKDSHYSIFKIARLFRMKFQVVNSQENGEMDYAEFEQLIKQNAGTPAIINANIGTTMKGAVDNISKIAEILEKYKTEFHVHADGALMGFVLPYIYNNLSFKKHINSIAISGHKFLGTPFPCGVFVTEKKFRSLIENRIDYIDSVDDTILGSRNGHAPLFLKHIITVKQNEGFKEDVFRCLYLAQWLVNRMQSLGIEAWMNDLSITVIFPRPAEIVVKRWQLASNGNLSHVVVMPHVTQEMLEVFLKEYLANLSPS